MVLGARRYVCASLAACSFVTHWWAMAHVYFGGGGFGERQERELIGCSVSGVR